jgi:YqcI/YcgG family
MSSVPSRGPPGRRQLTADKSLLAFEGFTRLQSGTLCPYAARARVTLGPAAEGESSLDRHVSRCAEDMTSWAQVARATRSHGYVMQVPLSNADEFLAVKRGFGDVLRRLSRLDPNGSSCMQRSPLVDGWQFEFGGLRLFLNVFAPCYPQRHSKHVDTQGWFYIFAQPEFSFDLCGINSRNRLAKSVIRDRFAEAGMPYDGALIDQRHEALLYMFPLRPGDPPVRWWDSLAEVESADARGHNCQRN